MENKFIEKALGEIELIKNIGDDIILDSPNMDYSGMKDVDTSNWF